MAGYALCILLNIPKYPFLLELMDDISNVCASVYLRVGLTISRYV